MCLPHHLLSLGLIACVLRSKGSEEESEQEKKRKRLDKLAAWRSKTAGEPVQQAVQVGEMKEEPAVKAEEPQAWSARSYCTVVIAFKPFDCFLSDAGVSVCCRMPWEDPATAFTGAIPKPLPKMTAVPAAPAPASITQVP